MSAGTAAVAAAFVKDARGMTTKFILAVWQSLKNYGHDTKLSLNCRSAVAVAYKICGDLPALVAGGTVRKLLVGGAMEAEGIAETATAIQKTEKAMAVEKLKDASNGLAGRPVEAKSIEESAAAIQKTEKIAALKNLKDASDGLGQLTVYDGKARFKINLLYVKDSSGILLDNAVRTGAIDVLETGTVVGTRVPSILTRLAKKVPADHQMIVKGDLWPDALFSGFKDDLKQGLVKPGDLEKMREALKKLKVDQACKTFHPGQSLERCGNMKFEFDARYPDRIQWSSSP